MKRKLFNTLSLLVGAAPLCIPLAAQSPAMTANIPFAFVAQHQSMPAGEYRVQHITAQHNQFVLRSEGGKSVIVNMGVNLTGDPASPKLTFFRSGNEYVLAKIVPPNSDLAYGLTQASIEKNLRRKVDVTSMVSVPLQRH